MDTEAMESHGLRLAPRTWRRVEALAEAQRMDRSAWLRQQIEALLRLAPDVRNMHDQVINMHDTVELSA